MRFMMLMIPRAYGQAAPDAMPDAAAVRRMMEYNESMRKAGVLIALEGLHPPAGSTRIAFAGGKPQIVEPPFPDVREALGGYWLIDVGTQDDAIGWALRCPADEGDVIEIRQVQEFAEFPAEVQAVAAAFPEMQTEFASRR
jgi:hypothetical protein